MGLSGRAAVGAQDALLQMLAARRLQEQMQMQAEQAKAQQELQQARLSQDAQQHTDRLGLDRARLAQQGEQFDTSRRERANVEGLRQRNVDREAYETEVNQRELGSLVEGMPEGAGRRVVELRRRGVSGVGAEDVMTPDERKAAEDADVARAGRVANAQYGAAARHRAPQEPDYKPAIVDGKQTYLTPEEIRRMGGVQPEARRRPVTGMERNNLAFYQRAQQAEEIVSPLEESIAKMSLGQQTRLQVAPNFLQTPENQRYRQAQRAFTEARLRKESGAAIPTAEYENDARTYFAQPGDDADTIAQKQTARRQVLEGLAIATGQAWEEYYGESRERGAGPAEQAPPPNEQSPNLSTVEYVRDPKTGKLVRK
jgi:hypothetical protein